MFVRTALSPFLSNPLSSPRSFLKSKSKFKNHLFHAYFSPANNPLTVCENASTTPPPTPLPSSAYVHLPFCRKRCHYCDFPVVPLGSLHPYDNHPSITPYIDLLTREINATAPIPSPSPLSTIFFGGGTPSLVPPRLIMSVLEALDWAFGVRPDAEVSIEMDPGTFDKGKLREVVEMVGVNRVSLGVQAFQEELLKGCGRAHGVKEVFEAIEIIGESGLSNWSMDLISSLPHQTPEMWEESLHLAVEARPTHLSIYDLQLEQGTKFAQWYTPGQFPLPSETKSAMFYRIASEMLSKEGFNHYEISSYCMKGYECKHNLTYWENKPFYGFGLGSASYINGTRFSRPKKLKDYTSYVHNLEKGLVDGQNNNHVDAKDMAMDVVMLSLRMARGLDLKIFGETYGESLALCICKAFEPYVESGHVLAFNVNRRSLSAEEFSLLISSECNIGNLVSFVRLSDPDGFLLSNEVISTAFGVMSP